MPRAEVGIVGLGLLGSALTERLVAAGFDVVGFDLDAARREEAAAIGAKIAASVAEVAKARRRIVLSLPDSNVVRAVVEQLMPHLQNGDVILDTTTGDPEATAELGARLETRGVQYLDATIAGSSQQARSRDVIVMAGGRRETFDACGDVLGCFARESFYVGPHGSGARMKLIVNLVLGLNRAVLAEGLALADAWGLELGEVLKVLIAGPTYSRVMDTKGGKMIQRDFEPQARLAQHLKDVKLILAAGERLDARLPLSTVHRELLEQLVKTGAGALDNSAIIQAFDQSPPLSPPRERGRG